jgi:outer membrane lipoprotein SlyB
MNPIKRTLFLACTLATMATTTAWAGDKGPKNEKFVLKLTSPISTATSKAGDQFTAVVLEPAEYVNAIVEGHVRKVEPAQNMEKPKAHILFDFDTLTVGDVTYKIEADMQEVTNSKGVAKVDEEGQVIAKGNGGKRAAGAFGGAGFGALAGGLLGGGTGALIGAAAGGLAGYLITVDVTSSSKNIEFYPGTQFTVQVNGKGVDKGVDASHVRQQEASAEAAMTQPAAPPVPAPDSAPAPAPVTTSASDQPAAPATPQP